MSDAATTGPVITLLTDFGQRDAYVAVMKGVVLTHCASARLVDLSHEIPAGDVAAASYFLGEAWRFFPEGAIHCAVIDPGVGTERRALVASADGQHFTAPDNGLLTGVLETAAHVEVRHATNEAFFASRPSHTFHGRDVFAPLAAALGRGVEPAELGDPIDDPVRLERPAVSHEADGVRGRVVHIDRFGNLVTDIPAQHIPSGPTVTIGSVSIHGLVDRYADGAADQPLAIVSSRGTLEIAVNRRSAAELLGLQVGQPVHVTGAKR